MIPGHRTVATASISKPRASGDNFESYILFSTREGQTPRRGLLSKQQMVQSGIEAGFPPGPALK